MSKDIAMLDGSKEGVKVPREFTVEITDVLRAWEAEKLKKDEKTGDIRIFGRPEHRGSIDLGGEWTPWTAFRTETVQVKESMVTEGRREMVQANVLDQVVTNLYQAFMTVCSRMRMKLWIVSEGDTGVLGSSFFSRTLLLLFSPSHLISSPNFSVSIHDQGTLHRHEDRHPSWRRCLLPLPSAIYYIPDVRCDS